MDSYPTTLPNFATQEQTMTRYNFNGLVALAASCMIIAAAPRATYAQTAPTTAPHLPQASQPAAADQLAIADMIARMNQAIDANDYSGYAAFYAEDGVIDSGFGPPTVGRAAIVASLDKSAPFITNKRHVAGNIVINGSSQSATAVYYLTVFERQTGLTLAGTAVITDEFKRGAAGWQVVRHTTRMDPATLQAMRAAMGAANR
jgi:ketosteroid isomerase-like protein